MKTFETLDLTAPGSVVGNHGVWLPGQAIKVPFQWGGLVTKYSRLEAGYPRETILDELAILAALAEKGMAPPVGDLVFFKNVVSLYRGAWHCDPCGAVGYEMADATKLPPGRFDLGVMRNTLPIFGSPGAWGDVAKPDNLVNGYLVDVRRTGSDLLRWAGPPRFLPDLSDPADELQARVHRECQYPAGERAEAYQDFWLQGWLKRGQRRVVERAGEMGFAPVAGESVLDIGCQSGSFLQFAYLQAGGAGRFAGVELEPGYVDCARALARSCGMNICVRPMNVLTERAAFLEWVRAYFPAGVDHLLLLSMEKHLGDGPLFDLVDAIGARRTYIETNAVAVDHGIGREPAGSMKLWPSIAARGGRHVGNSRDRNLRRLYQIEQSR